MSPAGIGAQSDVENALMRGAIDSMARAFTSVRWYRCEHRELNV